MPNVRSLEESELVLKLEDQEFSQRRDFGVDQPLEDQPSFTHLAMIGRLSSSLHAALKPSTICEILFLSSGISRSRSNSANTGAPKAAHPASPRHHRTRPVVWGETQTGQSPPRKLRVCSIHHYQRQDQKIDGLQDRAICNRQNDRQGNQHQDDDLRWSHHVKLRQLHDK
jgi:hypothetical protein